MGVAGVVVVVALVGELLSSSRLGASVEVLDLGLTKDTGAEVVSSACSATPVISSGSGRVGYKTYM